MKGILRLAFKLLVNDSAKFTAFLVGITFAVFLMIEMTSMFAGILDKASATVTNIGAKIGCALRLARADRTQFARPAPSVISRVWGGFGRGRRAAASIGQVGQPIGANTCPPASSTISTNDSSVAPAMICSGGPPM